MCFGTMIAPPRAAMNRLKLEIELVPHDSWGRNLRTQVRKSVWDKIRKEAYAKAEERCEVCGSGGKLSCHEVWECDDAAATQLLKGFKAVCGMCHHVNHYGMSTVLWRQGRLDLEAVDRHFLEVNQVDAAVLAKHKREAGQLFLRRAKVKWRIDFGPWQGLWEQEQTLLNSSDASE
jgi:hypothetical protein